MATNTSMPKSKLRHPKTAEKLKEIASAGGKARNANLTPERRREIARNAGLAKTNPTIRAECIGVLKIGEIEVDCAVLPDGRRVLSRAAVMRALGMGGLSSTPRIGGGDDARGPETPRFLGPRDVAALAQADLLAVLAKPIHYTAPRAVGATLAHGLPAEALPRICWVWVKAERAGLLKAAGHFEAARQAQALLEGVATVGIIALVDEATGYQEKRGKEELRDLLDRLLGKELSAWAKRFPDSFYQAIFKLHGWSWLGAHAPKPWVVARYTKDIIYSRLSPGIVGELEKRRPKETNKGPKPKLHCHFTDEFGIPALSEHIRLVTALLEVSSDWADFMVKIDKVRPRQPDTLVLPSMADKGGDGGDDLGNE